MKNGQGLIKKYDIYFMQQVLTALDAHEKNYEKTSELMNVPVEVIKDFEAQISNMPMFARPGVEKKQAALDKYSGETLIGMITEEANRAKLSIIYRIQHLSPDETDMTKLADALKVLHTLQDSVSDKNPNKVDNWYIQINNAITEINKKNVKRKGKRIITPRQGN